jgi:hypothetical protein
MNYRKLRIGFSAMCLIGCALIIVSWVASYYYYHAIDRPISSNHSISIGAYRGMVFVSSYSYVQQPSWELQLMDVKDFDADFEQQLDQITTFRVASLLRITKTAGSVSVLMTHGMFAALLALGSIVSWRTSQYSLRTLLIGMTLLAVGLGAIVYSVR